MFAALVFQPNAIWSQWNFQPFQTAPALVALALYGVGLFATGIRAVSRARAACFVAGVFVALGAVVSPLHGAAGAKFSMHMVQHQVLMLVAAPLLIAGRPGLVMALALPIRMRKMSWAIGRTKPMVALLRLLRNPLLILLVYAGVLWIWHLPGPYDAAVQSNAVHSAEHISFFGIALAFWAGVMRTGPRRRMRYVPAMMLVLGTMLLSNWLAAILSFGRVAYPTYVQRAALLRIDPLPDRQLAGSIMWLPSTIVSFGVLGVLFARWLRELDARHPRRVPVMNEP
jgi:cytochrome c oxidase assembly factor CtaG